MSKKSLKFWLFWSLVLIIIIAFLYPKPAGHSGYGMTAALKFSYLEKEYSCFGYKYDATTTTDTGRDYKCIGIPYLSNCFEITYDKTTREGTKKEIACS